MDFSNILLYPSHDYAGIIVIRTADQSLLTLNHLLASMLGVLKSEPIHQRLWIVEKDRIRIRGED